MNTQININLLGKENVQEVMKNAKNAVSTFASDAIGSNKSLAQSAGQASAAVSKVGSSAVGTSSALSKAGSTGKSSFMEINHGASKADSSIKNLSKSSGSNFEKIKSAAVEAGTSIKDGLSKAASAGVASLKKMGSTGASALSSIDSGISGVIAGMGELESLLSAVIGGFGMMELASMAWGGATQRQFNEVYLQTVMSKEEALKYQDIIANIVADVPGDDTFMNALITGALAKETSLSVDNLKMLGKVASYYVTISSQQMGGLTGEYEREIKDYILTGNTGLMERDGLLRSQMHLLKGKETIEERILAVNEALIDAGFEQIPIAILASSKAEELKGKFQLAATELGTKILPYVTKFLDLMIELDDKTGGVSSQIALIGGAAVSAGAMLGLVYNPIKNALSAAKSLAGWIKDKIPSTKITTVKCVKDPSCSDIGTSSGKISTTTPSWFDPGATGVKGFLGGLTLIPALKGSTSATVAAMSGTTMAGTVTGAGVLGAAYGYGTNWLDQMGKGSSAYGASRLISPITYLGAPLQSAAGLWGDVFSGRITKDPTGTVKDYLEGFAMPKGLKENVVFKQLGDLLLPGTAHAAGTGVGGKKSVQDDVFGKNGLFDFSRFKIPQLKWPSTGQILTGIIDIFPKLHWKLPNPGQILKEAGKKINPLNWKIPGVNSILGQTWKRIKNLIWNIPSVNSILGQTWKRITKLIWQIPTANDILNYIKNIIPPFRWPMGPGPSGPSGPGSVGLPRGPIKNTIASTMSNRSGVGQGYILGAMNRNFKGVDAFSHIADGMAAHLGYQFYFGDQKTNQQVWDSGLTNCYDGAQFLMSEASQRFGLSAGLSNGVWDGTGIAHTWSSISGRPFDMAAKLIRGHWNPPSGPGTFDEFMTDIGPGLEYLGYAGHMLDPVTALSSGGNCYDMTLGAMMVAENLFGLPGEMMWGTWNGQSHVWAKIGGIEYDPARRAREGTYNPPPQGPGRGMSSSVIEINLGGIHFHDKVNGVDDLERRMNKAGDDVVDKVAAHIFSQFGG